MSQPGETTQVLNQKRRRAVEMRLAGASLAQVRAATGLSAPTVISAYKAFRAGGWPAVTVKGLGRHVGQGRRLSAEQEQALLRAISAETPAQHGLAQTSWSLEAVLALLGARFGLALAPSTAQRYLTAWGLDLRPLREVTPPDAEAERWATEELPRALSRARARRARIVWLGQFSIGEPSARVLCAASLRGHPNWLPMPAPNQASAYRDLMASLLAEGTLPLCVLLHGIDAQRDLGLAQWIADQGGRLLVVPCPLALERRGGVPSAAEPTPAPTSPAAFPLAARVSRATPVVKSNPEPTTMTLTHLQRLEAEAIHVMREVVAEAENPVMLYSIGKDSACMLRLAQKAFYPSVPPFPLLHVDTTWKFRDMYALRDRVTDLTGMKLLVYQNPEAKALGINPFDHGSQIHTDMWKTQGLKMALDHYGFDAAFGGARRDEEKSRAKERIFSFRSDQHRWDPKAQRPELWRLYNARKRQGESMRVFPLSNWTELDVWQYIHLEDIPIVPLYFAKERPVVDRDGTLIMVDDERMPLKPGEVPVMRKIRFRTLGCYPLSGGIESEADTLTGIIQEMLLTRTSERQGRLIDHDQAASMEKKKQEGYF